MRVPYIPFDVDCRHWRRGVLGEFRGLLYPTIIGKWTGVRDRTIGAESEYRNGQQCADESRRIWCPVCVVGDGFRSCADVSGHQIRGETFGGECLMTTVGPKNLGISRQLAVTVSIVSVVLALIVLVIGSAIGVVNSETLIAFVGTLGVVIPSLVSALKSAEAADTASKVSNTVQFTASQHATILQMLQSYQEDMQRQREPS